MPKRGRRGGSFYSRLTDIFAVTLSVGLPGAGLPAEARKRLTIAVELAGSGGGLGIRLWCCSG